MTQHGAGPGTTDPALIRAYFHLWEKPHPHRHSHDEDPEFWAHEKWIEALIGNADEAWGIVLDLIDAADDYILPYVAAGPLEDFVNKYGETHLDQIEEAVRRWPDVRKALGSIFLPDSTDVRGRLSKYLPAATPADTPAKAKTDAQSGSTRSGGVPPRRDRRSKGPRSDRGHG